MNPTSIDPAEQRLIQALTDEAARVTPPADGLVRIQARLAQENERPAEVIGIDRPRVRNLRNAAIAGIVAVGLVAAATVFAVSGGIRPAVVDEPATTPSSAAPTPTSTATFDAPRPDVGRTVYRVGDDPSRAGEQPQLFTEQIRNVAPYAARQSLDGLFGLAPLNRDYSDLFNNGRNRVASTTETADALVVDMAEVDTVSRPVGTPDDAATARVWVQAWVDTIQDGYHSDKPVLITVGGRPTTLYGFVDTATPITRDPSVKITESVGIYLPRPDEAVSSPTWLTGSLPDDRLYHWNLVNLTSGFRPEVASIVGPGVSSLGVNDLPAGPYRVTLRAEPAKGRPEFVRTVEFTVGPAATAVPSSDPQLLATGPLAVTPIFFPDDRGVTEEWRPTTSPEEAMITVLTGRSDDDAVDREAFAGFELRSITRERDRLVLDVTAPTTWLDRPVLTPSAAQALLATANGAFGTDLPLAISAAGQTRLTIPSIDTAIRVRRPDEIFTPGSGATVGRPIPVVGALATGDTSAVWYLSDGVTDEPLFQGEVLLETDRSAYGFTLPITVTGRYALRITRTTADGTRLAQETRFSVR